MFRLVLLQLRTLRYARPCRLGVNEGNVLGKGCNKFKHLHVKKGVTVLFLFVNNNSKRFILTIRPRILFIHFTLNN